MTIKDAYPIPCIDESLSTLGDAKFFRRWIWALRSGKCQSGARSAENGLRVRAGIVPVEEDAVRIVQRDVLIPANNGPGTHNSNKQIREPHLVLRR